MILRRVLALVRAVAQLGQGYRGNANDTSGVYSQSLECKLGFVANDEDTCACV
jgi:hypothetical protein